MNEEKIADAIDYIDIDLVLEADIHISTPVRKVPRSVKFRLALAAACLALSCMLFMAVPFLSVDAPMSELPVITQPSDTEPLPPSSFITETPSVPPSPIVDPTPNDKAYDHLTLDVNPSVDLTMEESVVVDCTGINPEGIEILEDINIIGLNIEIALPILLESMINKGYISEVKPTVMLISAYGSENADELLKLAEEISSGVCTSFKLTTFIITQKLKYDINTERFASAYGVSLGKMQYVLNLLEKSNIVSFDSIAKAVKIPLSTLLIMDMNDSYASFYPITDGYNDYGEKILIVQISKDETVYILWNDLSKEEQKEISMFYKPSFSS